METCANCGRQIGNLETPHIWQQQVVCSDCGNKFFSDSTDDDERFFYHLNGVRISNHRVIWPDGEMPVSHIASVKSERRTFSKRLNIFLTDLVRRSHVIDAGHPDVASQIIASLRQANPAIQIEQDSLGFFVLWW